MSDEGKDSQKLIDMNPGDQIVIRRGELAGWAAAVSDIRYGPGHMSQTAYFSEVSDLIWWLKCSLDRGSSQAQESKT